jgi:hypothetical protein
MSKTVAPSIAETAFNCPHCGSLTTQFWYDLFADRYGDDRKTPTIPKPAHRETLRNNRELQSEEKERLLQWIDKMLTGLVLFDRQTSTRYLSLSAENLHMSECYNCRKIAVWVGERLVFLEYELTTQPNSDLPDDIVRDYEEARSIVDLSPRAAAALLRLGVQKLCAHLGESGKDLNNDIKNLVAKGIDPIVQRSLDIVRVIGNESVHPGTIDLNDDRETGLRLFDLVNAIADQMISHPKKVQEMYAKLPEEKRKAVERRDAAPKKNA